MMLKDSDKFKIENLEGFSQEIINQMNIELEEDLQFQSNENEQYESFVRHDKWRIIQRYYNKI